MSLEVDAAASRVALLRARAHPLRLRMLSLLTGADMSAAELSRELAVSQALASYHLRQLRDAGLAVLVAERSHRGGKERRYRHIVGTDTAAAPVVDQHGYGLFLQAMLAEVGRRSASRVPGRPGLMVDAELWVTPEMWDNVREAMTKLATELHAHARPPRSAGAVPVNATVVLFAMQTDAEPGNSS